MSLDERFRNEALEQLKELLRIPSISALPEHKDDIQKAADFVEAALKRAGMSTTTQVRRGEGNPLVYGAWTGAPGKPTVLLYGHYDVQPPDRWRNGRPARSSDRAREDLFGRGTSDDKGQTWILIKAVERLMHLDGTLPVNVKFLIEGEEESGGESIETYVAEKPAELACDAVVICDTEMFAAGPADADYGVARAGVRRDRGGRARQDLHSGSYGGAAPNVLMAIAEILTALKHRDGRVLIPRFYERVKAPAEAGTAGVAFAAVQRRGVSPEGSRLSGADRRAGLLGAGAGVGAADVRGARHPRRLRRRRREDRNSGARHGEDQHAAGARPAAGRDVALLKEAIAAACPRGVKAEFKLLSAAPASVVDVASPFISKACEALDAVFGRRPYSCAAAARFRLPVRSASTWACRAC